jgi:hypothetical protein
VAGAALKGGVRAGKGITRVLQMVKLGVEPTVHRVAAVARVGEMKSNVVEHRSQEVFLVAGVAGRGQAPELTHGRLLMARIALHQRVRSHQREAVLVVSNRLQRSLPALHRVAVSAIGAELAAMDIGMAVAALRTHVLEHHAGVALTATYVLVHAAQRISGQIVVECGIGADRLPACVGMTIGARCGDRTMGIGHLGLGTYTHTYTGA